MTVGVAILVAFLLPATAAAQVANDECVTARSIEENDFIELVDVTTATTNPADAADCTFRSTVSGGTSTHLAVTGAAAKNRLDAALAATLAAHAAGARAALDAL